MFTFGFYDSMNGDRRYNATQMSAIFDGIIEDGVFSNIGEMFAVVPGTGLQVVVKTGRAWFKHTWNLNDAWLPMNLNAADPLRSRIDSVVLEINSDISVRQNSLKIITGTPATNPTPPTMKHEDGVDQYRLADVTVGPAATYITAANIAIKVGQGETPFVTAPLKAADITDLFKQWGQQFTTTLNGWDSQFNAWFENLKLQLTNDVVTNLQNQIDDRVKVADKATVDQMVNGTDGKWVPASNFKSVVRASSTLSQKFGLSGEQWPNNLFEAIIGGTRVSSTLAQKFGLSGDKWPNDLFGILSNAVLFSTNKFTTLSGGTLMDMSYSRARIQYGSYIGTGSYGSSSPSKVTCNFVPRCVIVSATGSTDEGNLVLVYGQTSANLTVGKIAYWTSSINLTQAVSGWGSATISWYNNTGTNWQMNQKYTYYWVAFGYDG